jgi:hypothetical protein
MVSRCLGAAVDLAERVIDARVLEVHTIKPLDVERVVQAAREAAHSYRRGTQLLATPTPEVEVPIPHVPRWDRGDQEPQDLLGFGEVHMELFHC